MTVVFESLLKSVSEPQRKLVAQIFDVHFELVRGVLVSSSTDFRVGFEDSDQVGPADGEHLDVRSSSHSCSICVLQ